MKMGESIGGHANGSSEETACYNDDRQRMFVDKQKQLVGGSQTQV